MVVLKTKFRGTQPLSIRRRIRPVRRLLADEVLDKLGKDRIFSLSNGFPSFTRVAVNKNLPIGNLYNRASLGVTRSGVREQRGAREFVKVVNVDMNYPNRVATNLDDIIIAGSKPAALLNVRDFIQRTRKHYCKPSPLKAK